MYSLIERMENTDEYEEYNYDESLHSAGHSRKGKSKKEAGQNKSTGEHGQGHAGRKVVENIQHGEEKRKEENKKSEK